MSSLTEIETLREILSKLNAEHPAGRGDRENQTQYQERDGDLLRRLHLEVDSCPGTARVLITGQIGVGKSSELWQFFRETIREKGRTVFVVYCDLEKEEHPERCGATGVFLTIFRDCWSATRSFLDSVRQPPMIRRFERLQEEILERLIDWLNGERTDDGNKVVFNFGGMRFPVRLDDTTGAVALILGKAAQHEAVSQHSERFGLAPDSLINLLNRLLFWLTDFHNGQPPVLIVDHVDKIRDDTSAREVLVEVVPQWKRIKASIIMTAPYEYTLGPMRHSVESQWGNPLMVYPFEIPEPDSDTAPTIYDRIVESCGLGSLIHKESLILLAHYSGGIPRTFVHFLIEACKIAHLAQHEKIEMTDAQAVVHRAESAYQDYSQIELDLLDSIDRNKTGLGAAATLLRSPIGLLVVEPQDGEQMLRVHPLANRLLERHRIRTGKVAV